MRRITTRRIVLEETIKRKDGRSEQSEGGGRVPYGASVKDNHGFCWGSVKISDETIDVKAELLLVPISVLAYFESHRLQDRFVVT